MYGDIPSGKYHKFISNRFQFGFCENGCAYFLDSQYKIDAHFENNQYRFMFANFGSVLYPKFNFILAESYAFLNMTKENITN